MRSFSFQNKLYFHWNAGLRCTPLLARSGNSPEWCFGLGTRHHPPWGKRCLVNEEWIWGQFPEAVARRCHPNHSQGRHCVSYIFHHPPQESTAQHQQAFLPSHMPCPRMPLPGPIYIWVMRFESTWKSLEMSPTWAWPGAWNPTSRF